VHGDHRADHHHDQRETTERRHEPRGDEQPADELCEATEHGGGASRPEPERPEHPSAPSDATAAPPSEQLLRAVRREGQSERDADHEQAGVEHQSSGS
jgi:hypothetical protein